jgi:competence protein ComEC
MWMLAVVVVLKLSARLWPGYLVWALAGAVVLTWDPWAMLQPGFWLSFVAVGVLMATGHALEPVQKQPNWASVWLGRVGSLVREQFIVTVALAPLGLLFFGQVSWVGLLANLLAIPWVTFVVTPLAMLGVIWSGAWDLAVLALHPLSMVLTWMASWPLPVVSTAMAPWGFATLALLGAVVLVLKAPLSWKLLCLPLMWPVLFWQAPWPATGTFELLAADVGQGNAVLVRTAQHSLLYDAGPRYSSESDAGHRVLVPLLAQSGERLDVLMLSHRDSDHTGGAAAVLSMQPQAALWSSLEDDHPLHKLRPGWTRCQAGQSWVWDGVLFEILHPPAQATGATLDKKTKPNAVSCVLRISQGTASALLAGDIEAPQELALVASGLQPVDLLLVPHHGSKTSSTKPFIDALKPQVAVVQAGYRNRYGHPAEPVVQRYKAMGIELVENTRCGAARWVSSEPQRVHCERNLARRYWHHILAP